MVKIVGWGGVRMIQASNPCLKDPLQYEEIGGRFIVLRLTLNKFNHQAHFMGRKIH